MMIALCARKQLTDYHSIILILNLHGHFCIIQTDISITKMYLDGPDNKVKPGRHIVVLNGSTFENSGVNFLILNVAKSWKNNGYKVTVICQDRNAKDMPDIDSYIEGQLKADTPLLKNGQIRVIVPDINNLIPIYAAYQYCEFQDIKSKTIQQMSQEELETNVSMTIKCLRAVCLHDRPYKVLSNYMILSGIIAARGLQGLNIPFDITVPGPALMYTVKPYPHLWPWVLPGFKKASIIFQHTQFVKTQFLKCFAKQIQQYKLNVKVKAFSPGMDPNKIILSSSLTQSEHQFLKRLNSKLIKQKEVKEVKEEEKIQINKSMSSEKVHQLLSQFIKTTNSNQIQPNFVKLYGHFSQEDQVILYVGALINSKGMGELLAIAPKLIEKRPTLKFIFCGSGPYRQHMNQLIGAYEEGDQQKASLIGSAGQFITQINVKDHFIKIDKKIRERIIFAGLFDQELINSLLPMCTIYLLPSKMKQSSSMGIVEGMCSGVTPICNDHSWLTQVLNNIQNQYPQLSSVIRVQSSEFFNKLPETIINTLEFIKNSKLGRKQYMQKIRQIAVNNFSWDHIAQILAEERQYFEFP